MPVDGDSIREIEHVLAARIAGLAGRLIGDGPPTVEVHFREDTVVYLVDCPQLARAGPEVVETLDRGVAWILRQLLDRDLAGPPSRTPLTPQSQLVVLRLD